jgi:hypothetical protein
MTVNSFSVNVDGIQNPGNLQMKVYDGKGAQLGVIVADQVGSQTLTSTFPGAASFTIVNTNYVNSGGCATFDESHGCWDVTSI